MLAGGLRRVELAWRLGVWKLGGLGLVLVRLDVYFKTGMEISIYTQPRRLYSGCAAQPDGRTDLLAMFPSL